MELRGRMGYAAIIFVAISLIFLQVGAQVPAPTGTLTQTCIITGQVVTPETCIVSAIPYMFIGIMLSFMIIALVYMLGSAFEYRPIQGWYRAELWEATKSAMLAGVIIATLVIMSAVANILAGASYVQPLQGGSSPLSTNLASLYAADNTYINQQLNYSYQAYASMLGLSFGVNLLKSVQLSFWLGIPIPLPVPPFPIIGALQTGSTENLFVNNFITSSNEAGGVMSITDQLTNLVIIPVMLVFQFQKDLFYYIVAIGLGILIPIGMIFRAIPLIRDVGGTIIAFGIGVAIIYPSLLVMLNLPISNYIYTFTSANSATAGCPFSSGLLCKGWNAISYLLEAIPGNIFVGLKTGSLTAGSAAALPIQVALGTVATTNQAVVSGFTNGVLDGFVTPLPFGIFPILNFIVGNLLGMILNFILFAIDLLFGLVIVGGITQVLGGKVRLGIGSKLSLS